LGSACCNAAAVANDGTHSKSAQPIPVGVKATGRVTTAGSDQVLIPAIGEGAGPAVVRLAEGGFGRTDGTFVVAGPCGVLQRMFQI
jgi:hypothetical protein